LILLDRGGQVTVTLPEGLELLTPAPGQGERSTGPAVFPFALAFRPAAANAREYSWQSERAPQRVQLAWRPVQVDFPVTALVDIKLQKRQARVRQRLRFPSPQGSPGQVLLRIPKDLHDRLRIVEGGTLSSDPSRTAQLWTVTLTGPPGKEHELTMEYVAPLPEAVASATKEGHPSRFPVALQLVQPVQATRGQTKVRIWADGAGQPAVTAGHWEELPLEIVPEQDSLPSLVLRGGLESSVLLVLSEPAVAPRISAVVDRVLVQATVAEGGSQTYRTRFLLRKLGARRLDVVLPLALLDLELLLNGKRVPRRLLDETGREAVVGNLVRLEEFELEHEPAVLELNYKIDGGRLESGGPFQITLRPPMLLGALQLGQTRWQVELPTGWMPLYARGGYNLEQKWGWHGPLLAPQPAATNKDLERWFNGSESVANSESEPNLVCWQTTIDSMALVYVPERVWLLVCSLLFLGLGLVLFFVPLPRVLLWSCVVAAGAGTAVTAVLWPGILRAAAYGCEPGAAWLLIVVGIQWMLHQRYRRQIVFMPGFTRAKAGSSLIRDGSSNRKRELSTVDESPKRASSVNTGQGT
jgi:hypothetical protein